MMWKKIQLVLQYLVSLIQQPVCADSIFVMSVTEFKTKILTAFENVNRVVFSADSQVPYDECLYKF